MAALDAVDAHTASPLACLAFQTFTLFYKLEFHRRSRTVQLDAPVIESEQLGLSIQLQTPQIQVPSCRAAYTSRTDGSPL